jgi:hypothetical protein
MWEPICTVEMFLDLGRRHSNRICLKYQQFKINIFLAETLKKVAEIGKSTVLI